MTFEVLRSMEPRLSELEEQVREYTAGPRRRSRRHRDETYIGFRRRVGELVGHTRQGDEPSDHPLFSPRAYRVALARVVHLFGF